jgi:hypothetical protein
MFFMKKQLLILVAFVCLIASAANAQLDLKTRPIGLALGNYMLSAEYGVKPNFGVEGELGLSSSKLEVDGRESSRYTGFVGNLFGKYYFKPDKGTDKFCIGLYSKFNTTSGGKIANVTPKGIKQTNFSLGFLVGYKWVSGNEKILVGTDLGFGRALVRKFEDLDDPANAIDLSKIPLLNWDVLFRFTVGYRISGAKN